MWRHAANLAALPSVAIVIALSAGALCAYRSGGVVPVTHLGDWHVWINPEALVLAPFGPESDALQPVTAYVKLPWLIMPCVAYVVAWGTFAFTSSRRRRQQRGFPVQTTATRNSDRA